MKKSLKALLPILLLTGLLFGLSMTASAADSGKRGDWVNSPNGWWFQCTDGTYPKNGLYEVDGTAYAFDANGYMVTGWHFFSDYWFYFKDSGAMQTGWFWDKASNAWYYLDPQYGYMYSDGVRYINGTRYAFTPSGQMVTGWYYETWYRAIRLPSAHPHNSTSRRLQPAIRISDFPFRHPASHSGSPSDFHPQILSHERSPFPACTLTRSEIVPFSFSCFHLMFFQIYHLSVYSLRQFLTSSIPLTGSHPAPRRAHANTHAPHPRSYVRRNP